MRWHHSWVSCPLNGLIFSESGPCGRSSLLYIPSVSNSNTARRPSLRFLFKIKLPLFPFFFTIQYEVPIWQPTPIPDTITPLDPACLRPRLQDCVNPSGQTASISVCQAWRSRAPRQRRQDERQMKNHRLRSARPKGLVRLNRWDLLHALSLRPAGPLPPSVSWAGRFLAAPEPQCPLIPRQKKGKRY